MQRAAGGCGTRGVQGVPGEKGNTGQIGTANVIYSEWTKVTFTGGGSYWRATISAPKITKEILDRGIIKTYFKFTGSDINEVPYVHVGVDILQTVDLGKIILTYSFNGSNLFWRYVIIPGGIGARRANFDYADYEAVKKAYNIPD